MKYKCITQCHGFRGRLWEKGEETDILPNETPPRHFIPVEEAPKEEKSVTRFEPLEVNPGETRQATGGFAHTLEKNKLPRILTTDKVPNNIPEPPPKKKVPRRKGAGVAKKSD